MQVPPLYSALKQDGQRLSVLLKKGQRVEAKPARPVTVYSLSLQDFTPPLFTLRAGSIGLVLAGTRHTDNMASPSELVLGNGGSDGGDVGLLQDAGVDIECGGGFYVRSLVDDLGRELASCAHVKELVRTKQGQFTLEDHTLREESWTIDDIARSLQVCDDQSKPSSAMDTPARSESPGDCGDHEEAQRKS